MKEKDAPLDFFSWHLYSNDPQDRARAARFYRQELDGLGFQTTQMHVTEWNTDIRQTGDQSAEAFALRVGGKGAAILTAAWIAMQENGVAEATFYRGPDPDMNAPTFHGLFFANGQPKRVALAFSLWAKMASHPQRLAVSSTPEGALWLLAGQDPAGEIALLIANPTDRPVKYTISGVDVGRPTLFQVSDADEQIRSPMVTGNVRDRRQYGPDGNHRQVIFRTVLPHGKVRFFMRQNGTCQSCDFVVVFPGAPFVYE